MPYSNQKYISTDLTTAVTGITGTNMPGPSGIMTALTVVWNYTAQIPEHAGYEVSIIGYPGNVADDGTGEAGALRSFLQGAQPYLWVPGPIDVRNTGLMGYTFRMDISVVGIPPEPDNGEAEFTLMFTALDSTDPADFPGVNPPNAPRGPDGTIGAPPGVTPNPPNEDGVVVITWDSGSALVTDEDGFVIERAKTGGEFPWDIAGDVPRNPDTFPNYTFTDNIKNNGFDEGSGTYKYRIKAFKLDTPGGPSLSAAGGETALITYSSESDVLNITGDLNMDMDWQSSLTFITNPSGIYTLVPNQKFDRLYNRGGDAFVDVKIPDPFLKVGPLK